MITEKLKIKRSKRLNEAIRKNIQLSIDMKRQNDKHSKTIQGRQLNRNKKRSKSNKIIDGRKNKISKVNQTSSSSFQDNDTCMLSEESSSD